jgi:chromosomal replication initiator protein DnaA
MSNYLLGPDETHQIWQRACEEMQVHVSHAVYSTWVLNNPVTEIALEGDTKAVCTITSPTAFHSKNLKKNLGGLMEETLNKIIGREIELTFKIGTPRLAQAPTTPPFTPTNQPSSSFSMPVESDQSSSTLSQPYPEPQSSFTNATPQSQANQARFIPQPPSEPHSGSPARVEDLFSPSAMIAASLDRAKVTAQHIGLRSDYTFETFAVSTTNEMAHAAATAVSQRPGTAYNPLFLYGGVGVGKTHLMHAIAHNILKQSSTTKIIYCSGEEFTNEIVTAIRNKNALKFKDKYRNAQVLMIDDIQFIAGKNTVQEEFFHTFNALTQQAHQVILTSDRPPHEINLLEDRLRSRFEAGLMVDIQQPSFELRTAILLIKAKANHLSIPMEMAKHIASRVDSARKIEGLIKRLKSAIELQHKELSNELIESILVAVVT